jgi:hypothetical protein
MCKLLSSHTFSLFVSLTSLLASRHAQKEQSTRETQSKTAKRNVDLDGGLFIFS